MSASISTISRRLNNPLVQQKKQLQQLQHRRTFAGGWDQRGFDLTADMMLGVNGERPKVVVEAFAPTGFDVRHTVRRLDEKETSDGTVHMNGSLLAFPFGCFLWKIDTAADVTVESLAPVILHRPKLNYLFIGCNKYGGKGGVAQDVMENIQKELRKYGIVVEQLNLGNAIGTFNIL